MDNEVNNPTSIKELGNEAVFKKNYEEAVLHYTHAIKLDETDHTLFSNRSFALLKIKNYYQAFTDANEAIKLSPTWPKGYFRRAEVEFATKHFTDAAVSYKQALQLKPDDINIISALSRCNKEIVLDRKADEMIPWVGAGVGIIFGVIVVISDISFTTEPLVSRSPVIMALLTIAYAMVGYVIARVYRIYVKYQRNHLLDPPLNLIENEDLDKSNQKNSSTKHLPRYTKSQARQKYKKGKL